MLAFKRGVFETARDETLLTRDPGVGKGMHD
jgi:hypothetical protein